MLGFFGAEEAEKDYSMIGSFSPAEAVGKCVYCNHCKPCPKGLDIVIINKYYDLARNGDSMAEEHYRNLETKVDTCAQCRHCESRCPFHVKQDEGKRRLLSVKNDRKDVISFDRMEEFFRKDLVWVRNRRCMVHEKAAIIISINSIIDVPGFFRLWTNNLADGKL